MLTTDAQERKDTPVYSGFVCYFPDAMCEVARLSKAGNDQHNPGSPLHWDRSKSGDEMDALMRHVVDGTSDPKGGAQEQILHARAVAWRAMAELQKLCEQRDENSNPQKSSKPNVHTEMRTLRRRDDGACDCPALNKRTPGVWHLLRCPMYKGRT